MFFKRLQNLKLCVLKYYKIIIIYIFKIIFFLKLIFFYFFTAPIIPEPERIEPVNCKLNLLENVSYVQNQISNRFDEIEKQLEGKLNEEMKILMHTKSPDAEKYFVLISL